VVAGTVVTVALAFVLYKNLKQELIPDDDRGFFLVVASAPEGSSLEYTDGYVRQIEQIIGKTRASKVLHDPRRIRWGRQPVVYRRDPQRFGANAAIPSSNSWVCCSPSSSGSSVSAPSRTAPSAGVQPARAVRGTESGFRTARTGHGHAGARARAIKGLTNVDTDLRVNKPELRVTFDRDRAEDLGVPVRDVAAALQTFLGGRRVSTFTRNDKLYYVMVQLDPGHRATRATCPGFYLRGRGGQLVQLAALAKVAEGVSPRQINHFNRVPSFTLTASLIPPFSQGDALDSLDRAARQVLPPGSTTALAVTHASSRRAVARSTSPSAWPLLVVFMVLASQFESMVHPFTVLLSVPLAITGALATLLVVALAGRPGGTINLYSEIGMILLIGLVTRTRSSWWSTRTSSRSAGSRRSLPWSKRAASACARFS